MRITRDNRWVIDVVEVSSLEDNVRQAGQALGRWMGFNQVGAAASQPGSRQEPASLVRRVAA